ncbi:hypothetical protein GVY41_09205 [Frigidibacter albus]|uniref:L-2-amino-thiazoline-4-carboxylic acid hydrolase n=1 Tax=Frigidibacter albus TaxID=1465486 RepID=A0A6L8VHU2_9RHOB|nr:L-2-amino-thiazoline-4-carboxylic acid hydrolase [Frigidibacter albus]MZQ89266.1 hypothetical protein [Frigidibacter albus]NBE31172.1 hypothetical protein [Frigidibacter albus]GGH53284.1 hypothetical protein GCM10011341_18610 [Frigidibacter albus]
MTHPYYAARAPQIAAEFRESLRLAAPAFAAAAPRVDLDALWPEIAAQLTDVISVLPWVGGDGGRMTGYFEQNAGVIALGRVLIAQGLPKPTVAQLLQRTFLARLGAMDRGTRAALGQNFMSPASMEQLRRLAEESRQRANPGDFVYTYVEAGQDEAGEPFEFGLNYQECGFCKLCGQTGDTDILPMICGMDEESYALRGVRLTRTQTLAGGASHCNFRYRLMTTDDMPDP